MDLIVVDNSSISSKIASHPSNQIPFALIDDPIIISLSQRGIKASSGSLVAIFVDDDEVDVDVQHSLNILYQKLYLTDVLSLCKIIPPVSRTLISAFDREISV
ncbi:MAG: hypothetical protein EZS28_010591 [Streblomastix strix]|uniref:Uncharacterized protein n=1 Tax=Streblomastix strix TaxID=222440 RepID=A0A5J4WFW0_9EUKA|nr:MAG: hypothetical protein EZS28_010591 [Streblomastix strix]